MDDLENEAAARRRGDGGRRNAGESRNPRKSASEASETVRREELARREQERLKREQERRQREEKPEGLSVKEEPAPPPSPSTPETEAAADKKQQRPKSMPFYPNPEHETFLWRVTEAGAARQERIPATAVLRLALTRLEQQMTPGEIVQLLGEAVQPAGKMGRPRK
ncbi:hypothetical protein [Streptomyces sp. NPDC002324]